MTSSRSQIRYINDEASRNPPLLLTGVIKPHNTSIGREPRLTWASQLTATRTLHRTALSGLGGVTTHCFDFKGTVYRMGDWVYMNPVQDGPPPKRGKEWVAVILDYSVTWIWDDNGKLNLTHGQPGEDMRVIGVAWAYSVKDIRKLLRGGIEHHRHIMINNAMEENSLKNLIDTDVRDNVRYFSDEVEWYPLSHLIGLANPAEIGDGTVGDALFQIPFSGPWLSLNISPEGVYAAVRAKDGRNVPRVPPMKRQNVHMVTTIMQPNVLPPLRLHQDADSESEDEPEDEPPRKRRRQGRVTMSADADEDADGQEEEQQQQQQEQQQDSVEV
ncbi:uncharacterized protein BXZ73DRAFT_79015 [Epithele typhae]|uniref:uncharacterized protein n=1 Tax=Epithele typhae TaxID=378194 RepID=UPI00200844F3|nr:uncharacterized protein BXZ73DRAFT_79015 [Epithele typhae]KAH9925345.1 hypothetical protein BXZ73DRAFT_79015 [Epithele typhae]